MDKSGKHLVLVWYWLLHNLCRALADTNADGKMDINEFSIACKLINLKLRGFEIPKVLPPNLIASLRMHAPPAIPPLPININQPPPIPPAPQPLINQQQPLINQPPLISQQPLITQQPLINQQSLINQQPLVTQQPLIPNLSNSLISQAPITSSGIPTGIVPPIQSGLPGTQSFIPPVATSQPLGSFGGGLIQGTPATVPVIPTVPTGTSLVSAISGPPLTSVPPLVSAPPLVPGPSLISAAPLISSAPLVSGNIPLIPGPQGVPVIPPAPGSVPSAPGSIHSATSTPRASISSVDRCASIDSP